MTDNKEQAAHDVQEELEEIAPGVFMKKADAEKQRAYNAAHYFPVENGAHPQPAPAHAVKEKRTQDAQEVTAQHEQLSLFAEQTPEEQTAAIFAEIAKDLAEVEAIRNSPEYKASDLLAKLDEIAILAERCSSPRAIKIVCKSAAEDAAELYKITGNKAFEDIADRLTAVAIAAFFDTMEQVQSVTEADKGTHSIVYTATGKDFVLPDELEAYRADNPLGAELYEQERAQMQEQEPPQADNKYSIKIDLSDYDPKLDPGTPEFDIEAWREAVFAVDENGETMSERTQRKMQESLSGLTKAAMEAMPKAEEVAAALKSMAQSLTEAMKANMQDTMQAAYEALAGFADFLQSETYTAIKESVRQVSTFIEEHSTQLEAVAAAAEETEQLYPFLQLEIDELNAKAAATGEPVTLDDVLSLMEINGEPITDVNGEPVNNPFIALIERAKERKADYEAAQELTATVEQLEAELPILQAIVPAKHTMPNNALMNALQTGQKHDDGREPTPIINAGEFDLPVVRENTKLRRKEITAYTMVSCDDNNGELQFIGGKMTEYERQVSDAVISLYIEAKEQGLQPVFTTDMIFRAMPGGGDKASAQQKGAITKAIDKMRRLKVVVDATAELRQRGIIGKDKTFTLDDYYLSAAKAEYKVKNGGQIVAAYKLHAEPLILRYSRQTKQLITVNAKFLEIKKVKHGTVSSEIVTMNANRQAMTGYMLRRIAVMKKDIETAREALRAYNNRRKKDPTLEEKPLAAFRKQSDTILFATLFKETGTETTNRDRIMDNRNFCFDVLDYWKATGYIKGYKQQTKGRSITGVDIIH